MISHLLHVPSAPVSFFVENMWLVRGRMPQTTRQVLLPDGAMAVMFNLGEPQRVCDRDDLRRHTVYRASWVSGQQPQPLVLQQAGQIHLAGIRFHPGGAWPLFRFSLAELTGRVLELEDIWGRDAARVREQLGDTRGDRALLACLERWLAFRLRDAPRPDARVSHAAARLQAGGTGVARIADEASWSHKHLVHEFTRRVGLAPKHYGRVQRLQRALRHIGFAPTVDWADVALTSGYYDQAHLINEFRELAGVTPSELLGRRLPYLGYLSVA